MRASLRLRPLVLLAQAPCWATTPIIKTRHGPIVGQPHVRTPRSLSSWYDLKPYSERAILEVAGEPRAAEKDCGHDTCRRRSNHAYRCWSLAAAAGAAGPAHDGDSRRG